MWWNLGSKALLFLALFVCSTYCQCTTISLVYGYAPESGQNGNNGYIENNRGPGNRYFRNESCGWQITVTKGSVVRFVFQSVELENSTNCENDWVEIRDGFEFSNSITGRICNSSVVGQWFYTTDCVGFVYFQTNNHIERRGFILYWERVPSFLVEPVYSDTMSSPSVVISSGKEDISMKNTTNEMHTASLSLVISITSVVGVTFGIALVVVTGILICVVFPRKRDLTEKVVSNYEIDSFEVQSGAHPNRDRLQTLRVDSRGHSHFYTHQSSEDRSSADYENMSMVIPNIK